MSAYSAREVRKGAIAGLVATVPMTLVMLIGWRFLPRREQYALPPREITEEITEKAGWEAHMTNREITTASLVSHFIYGAVTGSAG